MRRDAPRLSEKAASSRGSPSITAKLPASSWLTSVYGSSASGGERRIMPVSAAAALAAAASAAAAGAAASARAVIAAADIHAVPRLGR